MNRNGAVHSGGRGYNKLECPMHRLRRKRSPPRAPTGLHQSLSATESEREKEKKESVLHGSHRGTLNVALKRQCQASLYWCENRVKTKRLKKNNLLSLLIE